MLTRFKGIFCQALFHLKVAVQLWQLTHVLNKSSEHHSELYHYRQFNFGLWFSPLNPPGQLLEERAEREKPGGKKLDLVVVENPNGKEKNS